MNISEEGLGLIKQFEGCRLSAYPDPGTGGDPWTIGYGWTQPVDGKPVKRGMKIDQETADRLLRCGVVQFEQAVSKVVHVRLTQHQFDALVAFTYNVGQRAFSSSTLLQLLNKEDYSGAADQFLRWNKSGGRVLAGLTKRREAERALFLS